MPDEPVPEDVDAQLALALLALGAANARHGRLDEAERLYRRALDIVGAGRDQR